MDIKNKSMIYWNCHRGMRELDLIFITFFNHEYNFLTDNEKKIFIRLLTYQDFELFLWLMNQEDPEDNCLYEIIKLIQYKCQSFSFIEF